MYEYAMDRLAEAGFEQYEISNWARRTPDGRLLSSRHNLQYWYNQPYLGFGPGAHGYAGGFRTMNVGGIKPFIERCSAVESQIEFPAGPATRRTIPVDRMTEMQETMMVGLRLTLEGVSAIAFKERFAQSLVEVFGKEIDMLMRNRVIRMEWPPGVSSSSDSPRAHAWKPGIYAVCRLRHDHPRAIAGLFPGLRG